jgi:hypothetical protein
MFHLKRRSDFYNNTSSCDFRRIDTVPADPAGPQDLHEPDHHFSRQYLSV